MARAGAAIVLAFAVCCLLGAPALARWPVDLPPQLPDAVDREAAAEPLLPKLVEVADAKEAGQATAIAVPEEGAAIAVREEEKGLGRDPPCCASSSGAAARGSAQKWQALGGWVQRAAVATADEVHGEEQGAYDSDSDSDSDDEDEGGILGWFWGLAHGF